MDQNKQKKKEKFERSLRPHIQIEKSESKYIYDIMRELNIPAVSITVIENNEISWTQEYYSQSNNESKNFNPAIFQVASISKTINAVLAMKVLVESGLVGLDDDVNQYLKDWQIENPFDEKVTLRRLLSHTAGINVGGFYGYSSTHQNKLTSTIILKGNNELSLSPDKWPSPDEWPPPECAKGTSNNVPVKVIIKPGTKENYSGGGTTIIQKLIEDVTGESYAALAKKYIFVPLNMNSSTFETLYPEKNSQNIQLGYDREGNPIDGGWRIYPELAAVGLWTTSGDIAKFSVAILKALNDPQNGFISQDTAKALIQKQPHSQFGLGFEIYQFGEITAFGHGGTNEGYKCGVVILPDKQTGIVIMTNSDNGDKLIDDCKRSFFATYDVAPYPAEIKKPIKLKTEQLIKCNGKYQFTIQGKLCHVTTQADNTKLFITVPFPLPTSSTTKKFELIPESDHSFFSSEYNRTFVFSEDYTQLAIKGPKSKIPVIAFIVK